MSEITELSVQSKDKSRCNVYVDGRFSCGLSIEVALKNRLKVGLQVDDEFLARIQLEGEKDVALSKALSFVTLTQKTKKQVRDHLTKKGYLPAVVEYVLDKMTDYKFLDDEAYASSYCEAAAKKKGKKLIQMELRAKGVADEDMDAALDGVDEESQKATATLLLQKYMRGKSTDKETLAKAFRYLISKGFGYETARSALSTLADTEAYDS
ncbi:MAG: RecX family transcriptional regulator [Clostridia bacterium]|nr:RecX family transcriptional regulator [Clostridia bacterium]